MFNPLSKNAGNTTRWLILGALGILLIINPAVSRSIWLTSSSPSA